MSSGGSNTPFRGCVVRVRSQRAHRRQLTYRAAQLENISEFRMDDRLSGQNSKIGVMSGMVTILLVLSGQSR
jgi:hypothetical protein